jgi:hypothetical protein
MNMYQSQIEQRQNAQTIEKPSCLKAVLHALLFPITVISIQILKTKRNIQDKKLQYRGYLIMGLVITFLLVGNITYTNAQGKSSATISSKQHELRDIKTLHSLQLDFKLVGTIIASEENSYYAVIEDETTGKQGIYKLGESVNEATVLKIDKESIIVEKDGTAQVLRIKGGSSSEMLSGDVSPSTGVSEGLSYFEPGPGTASALSVPKGKSAPKGKPAFPVVSLPANTQGEAAIEALADKLPEVAAWYGSTPEQFSTMLREDHTTWIDTDGHLFFVEELPPFEPVINRTGPPVDPEGLYEDLPEFIPSESDSGPPGM